MHKFFFMRLALTNVRKNRITTLPHLIATAVMSGVFLLISGLTMTKTLSGLPSGDSARMIFAFGQVVFALFTFCFMAYINGFLIKRRKKEFGLYGVLGLSRGNVARILVWENFLILGFGVLLGVVFALVFGQLVFLILLRIIRVAVPNSRFSLSPWAFVITGGLFLLIFLYTTITNLLHVRTANPVQLLSDEKRGEKDGKLLLPVAIVGLVLLVGAYYFAWTIEAPGVALGVFFPLATLVIIATYLLFKCGSIALLRLLRANKRLYYKPAHFVTISGLFHRMRQNSRALATLCILSTMLVVTVSGTLSLYLGREEMNRGMYPFDVAVWLPKQATEADAIAFDGVIQQLAAKNGIVLSSDESKLVRELAPGEEYRRNNFVFEDSVFFETPTLICFDRGFRFDASGAEADCLAFVQSIRDQYAASFDSERPNRLVSDVFTARQEGYGTFGGLLFLGVFFALLFLAVAVLILYFKQISEGYEDRERFIILQQVGMDDSQVKQTINRQVLWVFFLPLAATAVHMTFASKIMARMLKSFMLYDWGMVLSCIGGSLLIFSLLYLGVYRLTAKTYYRIVRG